MRRSESDAAMQKSLSQLISARVSPHIQVLKSQRCASHMQQLHRIHVTKTQRTSCAAYAAASRASVASTSGRLARVSTAALLSRAPHGSCYGVGLGGRTSSPIGVVIAAAAARTSSSSSSSSSSQQVHVEGVVRRITFRNESSGFTVARVESDTSNSSSGLGSAVVIVGEALHGLNVGQCVVIEGMLTRHAKYGKRVQVTEWREADRESLSEAEAAAYLAGILPGVGSITAKKMIARFGSVQEVFAALDVGGEKAARKLSVVPGISLAKAAKMVEKWDETRQHREAARFLQDLGLQASLAERLAMRFGNDTAALVEKDPYSALRGVRGGSWDAMESVAERLGVDRGHVSRVLVAIELALLSNAQVHGNTFGYSGDIVRQAMDAMNSGLRSGRRYGVTKAPDRQHQGIDEMGMLTTDYVLGVARQHGAGVIVIEDDDASVEQNGGEQTSQTRGRRRMSRQHNSHFREQLKSRMYLSRLHQAEEAITDVVMRRVQRDPLSLKDTDVAKAAVEKFIAAAEKRSGIELSEEQREVLHTCSRERMVMITGGPGSGKTLITNFIAQYFAGSDASKLRLCAPTARAAIRMQAVTGKEATTIHRMLGYESKDAAIASDASKVAAAGGGGGGIGGGIPGSDVVDGVDVRQSLFYNTGNRSVFKYNAGNKLAADVVIVDECSMIDVVLMESLLNAIDSDSCRLIVFVGDADQLPPVGPGSPFKCLLASGVVPTIRLNRIYRQENDYSLIVDAAHSINKGVVPSMEKVRSAWSGEGEEWPVTDCLWVDVNNNHGDHGMGLMVNGNGGGVGLTEMIASSVEDLITRFVPALGYDVVEDVQVMAPGRRGAAGCVQLNRVLQPHLNRATQTVAASTTSKSSSKSKNGRVRGSMEVAGEVFHAGDRVMQTMNDYDRDIFNGDQGVVTAIAESGNKLTVAYPMLLKGNKASSTSTRAGSGRRKRGANGSSSTAAADGDKDGVRHIEYTRSQVRDSLMLAWCTTVHKAQGGEYPVVVLALSPEHRMLNNRRLLYTGITRAKKLCILVSTEGTLSDAVKTRGHLQRLTWLDARVRFAAQDAGLLPSTSSAGIGSSGDAFSLGAILYRADKKGTLVDAQNAKELPGKSVWRGGDCFRINARASDDVSVAALVSNSDPTSRVEVVFPLSKDDNSSLTAYVPHMLNDYFEIEGGSDGDAEGANGTHGAERLPRREAVIVLACRSARILDTHLEELRVLVSDGVRNNEENDGSWCEALRSAASAYGIEVQTFLMEIEPDYKEDGEDEGEEEEENSDSRAQGDGLSEALHKLV